jgi:hypothetical protein
MNTRIGNFMAATILGREVPEGVTPITNERVRGSLLELYVAQRLGWRRTVANQHEGKDGAKQIVSEISKADADI